MSFRYHCTLQSEDSTSCERYRERLSGRITIHAFTSQASISITVTCCPKEIFWNYARFVKAELFAIFAPFSWNFLSGKKLNQKFSFFLRQNQIFLLFYALIFRFCALLSIFYPQNFPRIRIIFFRNFLSESKIWEAWIRKITRFYKRQESFCPRNLVSLKYCTRPFHLCM